MPWTHVPYGLRVDPDRPRDPAGVSLDEAKAAVVAEIFAAYLQPGASLFGVSRHLREMGVPAPRGGKAWSTATLRGILTNPLYAGRVYAGRVRYRPPKIRRSATHPIGHPHDSAVPLPEEWIFVAEVPAVVSQEQFDLVREKLSKNKSFDEIVWKDLCKVLTHPESITDALRRAHGGRWLPQELKARQEILRQEYP